MLVKIECTSFAAEHREITFNPGLNTIQGSSDGRSSIGKSTFLWIIDWAFGGDKYCVKASDVKEYVGHHQIYFTFLFEEQYLTDARNWRLPLFYFL